VAGTVEQLEGIHSFPVNVLQLDDTREEVVYDNTGCGCGLIGKALFCFTTYALCFRKFMHWF
jgi:hypothetical protein